MLSLAVGEMAGGCWHHQQGRACGLAFSQPLAWPPLAQSQACPLGGAPSGMAQTLDVLGVTSNEGDGVLLRFPSRGSPTATVGHEGGLPETSVTHSPFSSPEGLVFYPLPPLPPPPPLPLPPPPSTTLTFNFLVQSSHSVLEEAAAALS